MPRSTTTRQQQTVRSTPSYQSPPYNKGPVCGDGKCEQGEYFCGGNTPTCIFENYPGHDECVQSVQECLSQNQHPCDKDCPMP